MRCWRVGASSLMFYPWWLLVSLHQIEHVAELDRKKWKIGPLAQLGRLASLAIKNTPPQRIHNSYYELEQSCHFDMPGYCAEQSKTRFGEISYAAKVQDQRRLAYAEKSMQKSGACIAFFKGINMIVPSPLMVSLQNNYTELLTEHRNGEDRDSV